MARFIRVGTAIFPRELISGVQKVTVRSSPALKVTLSYPRYWNNGAVLVFDKMKTEETTVEFQDQKSLDTCYNRLTKIAAANCGEDDEL